VDEEGVNHLGSVEVPLEGKGLDRSIEVEYGLGETELVVRSRQKGIPNAEWVERSFDFLSNPVY
jgi:hypothetical protein